MLSLHIGKGDLECGREGWVCFLSVSEGEASVFKAGCVFGLIAASPHIQFFIHGDGMCKEKTREERVSLVKDLSWHPFTIWH